MAHHHHHSVELDTSFLDLKKGVQALRVSLIALLVTAVFQGVIVYFSGSAALLADTLHNLADAFTAVPLWIAFRLEKRQPDRRYTYGYSRFEDLAGVFIVLLILATAGVVAYESYVKLKLHYVPKRLEWVAIASVIGFFGNEWVARYRIRVGKEINSAALVADGHHARADSLTSLGVLLGVIGVWMGFPLLDPLMGFLISLAILQISWTTGRHLFTRLADAVSPEMVDAIKAESLTVPGVLAVYDARARYVGRHLRLELTIAVNRTISVVEGHEIAIQVQHALQHHFPSIVSPTIHVDPEGHVGEEHHFAEHHRGTENH